MALIKCPECEKEISDRTSACMHCGYPLSEIKKDKGVVHSQKQAMSEKKIILIFGIILLVGIILSLAVSIALICIHHEELDDDTVKLPAPTAAEFYLQQIKDAVVAEDMVNDTFDLSTDTIVKGSTKIGSTFDLAEYVKNIVGASGTITCTKDGVVTFTLYGESATWTISTGAVEKV